MEKIIEELEKELGAIIDGKPLKTKRKKLGDEIDVRFCRMIVFSLLWASVGYQSGLRLAGMKLGKSMGIKCEKTELGVILGEIKKIIERLREGEVEIRVMPDYKGVQFIISEGAVSYGVPNILQNICFFEEGFIEGYLDGAISKLGPLILVGFDGAIRNVSVKERRCIGLGDKYCEFLISF